MFTEDWAIKNIMELFRASLIIFQSQNFYGIIGNSWSNNYYHFIYLFYFSAITNKKITTSHLMIAISALLWTTQVYTRQIKLLNLQLKME